MPEDTWERFANADAEMYICTEIDASTPQGRQAFFRSGEAYVDHMLGAVTPYLSGRLSALEFGCGVGRLTIPVARRFERVTAVDIAPTMLEKLAANCQEVGVTNCTPHLSGDAWETTGPFDLAYSHLVFQHLPSTAALHGYLERMAVGLAPDGVCHLQFDTRPRNPGYRLRNALPDPVLPTRWRSGIRRIRRSPTDVHGLLAGAGLTVIDERGSGTELHEILARRAVPAPA